MKHRLAAALQAEIERSLALDPSLPGIAVTVEAPRMGLAWSGACGRAARDGKEALSSEHGFRIASVTKVYTAATALRLVEQGLLPLFTPIAPLIGTSTHAALGNAGHQPDRITVFQLLTHTSGLPDHASSAAYVDAVIKAPARVWTRDEQMAFAMTIGGPVAAAGTHFHYSDTGYLLIAEILERAAGQPLPALIRQQLGFARLALTQTHFERLEPAPPGQRRAHQYVGPTDANRIDPSCDLFGGGGIVSTTAEVGRFLRALLQGELFERPETLATALMTPSVSFASGDWLHSALLRGRVFGSEAGWSHGGFWGVQALYLPASDLCLVLAYNQAECLDTTRGAPGVPGLADRLVAIMTTQPL
jgi:D-alanyl-D-alanine carboxypeptidase